MERFHQKNVVRLAALLEKEQWQSVRQRAMAHAKCRCGKRPQADVDHARCGWQVSVPREYQVLVDRGLERCVRARGPPAPRSDRNARAQAARARRR
jgi:hypothetical protein